MTFIDVATDMPKERKITVGEQEVNIQCTDPYGLWIVKFPGKEKTPKELKGSYTSPYEAQKAVTAYLRNKK